MEPRIQYARRGDGVSIAFWTLGEGWPVLTMPPGPFSHLELEWQIPEYRRWYERLARSHKVIRYDGQGTGLSERNVSDFSLDARLRGVEAIGERLGLDKFALAGIALSGPAAIAYAARYPERVSHLFLWCTYAQGAAQQSPQLEALVGLIDTDWQLFTETVAHAMVAGWTHGEQARQFAALMRESVSPQTFKAMREATNQDDASDLLSEVRAPTLVLHRRQVPWPPLDAARELASGIPNARLALLEGASMLPFVGDMESVATAIDDFLGVGSGAIPAARQGGLATILFTDIERSTTFTQRLGDAKAREVLREHERIVRQELKSHGGAEVKTMGDGFMASFGSATRALECAIAIQRAFQSWNASARPEPVEGSPERSEGRAEPSPPAHPFGYAQDRPFGYAQERPSRASGRAGGNVRTPPLGLIRLRIGLNAGEPIAEAEDLFGTAVILAARIADHAQGGEILVSDVVRQLVAGKGFLFADRGATVLRGFEDPVRVYELRWREGAA